MFRNRRFIIFLIIAGAAAALIIFFVVRNMHRESPDVEAGLAYLHALEEQDPNDVDNEIKEIERKNREAQVDYIIEQIENDEISVWSQFNDSVILGDSRAMDFVYHNLLPDERVLADVGDLLRDADDHLDEIINLNPSRIFFTYGLNDVDGTANSAEDYGEEYRAMLRTFREALPNAQLYVCSILPVTEYAQINNPHYVDIPAYNVVLKQVCEEEGVPYINCDDIMDEHYDLYDDDGIHYFEGFYPIWAKRMIRKALEYEDKQS